jgi:hypothetical protein
MTVQPQPPNQPNQPNLAQDQLFNRITIYVSGQVDAITTRMRVDKQEVLDRVEAARQESLARDIELRNEQRAGFQALTDAVLRLTQTVQGLTQGQQGVTQGLQALTQEVREGFAAQAERHNELMVRVERLERGNNQPPMEPE